MRFFMCLFRFFFGVHDGHSICTSFRKAIIIIIIITFRCVSCACALLPTLSIPLAAERSATKPPVSQVNQPTRKAWRWTPGACCLASSTLHRARASVLHAPFPPPLQSRCCQLYACLVEISFLSSGKTGAGFFPVIASSPGALEGAQLLFVPLDVSDTLHASLQRMPW